MNSDLLKKTLGAQCEQVSDGLIYASTRLAMPFYGNAIGGYVQELANNRVRISDNADTIFEAIAHGVKHSQSRVEQAQQIVESFGLELSDAGEITVTCQANELDYFFARFIEASFAIANATLDWHPAAKIKTSQAFKREIDTILTSEFKERLTKNIKVMGSSGNQLTFHFALDAEQPQEKLIQTIGLNNSILDWNNIYGTLGKMVDISRISRSKRIVIIENADNDDFLNASTLLNEKSTVIPFINRASLVKALAA